MKNYKQSLIAVFSLIIALTLGVYTPTILGQNGITFEKIRNRSIPKIIELGDARLKFEINSTDEDGGVQVFIDAEPWKSMAIYDPNEHKLFRSTVKGSIGKQGGTEFFLESGEPKFSQQSLEELLALFPEGDYQFRWRGLEGEILVGTATMTHTIPDGPVLVSPLEGGSPVDPNNAVVQWEPVDDPKGVLIIAYQVLIVQLESDFPAIPKVTLDVMMPANSTSLAVPPSFLLPNTEYEWEVLAIEESGNQTPSTSFFKTAP